MSSVYQKTIDDFVKEAMSASPTPGGGNVSAVAAALAASMVCMVANLTIGKKAYAEYEDQAREAARRLSALIEKLKELTQNDMDAFEQLMAAYRLPKENETEKAARAKSLEQAVQRATMTPLEICQVCLEVLKQADEVSKYGNKMAISDAGVGALLAEAALRACMLSVDINLPSIKDQAFADKARLARYELLGRAEELKLTALARVKEKMS